MLLLLSVALIVTLYTLSVGLLSVGLLNSGALLKYNVPLVVARPLIVNFAESAPPENTP